MGTENLAIGKGEVWFAPFTKGTQTIKDGYRFLGNCPDFTLSHTTETLDHFSSTRGIRELDKKIVIESRLEGTIICEELNVENLAYFFNNTDPTTTTVAAVSSGTYSIANPIRGRAYQIGESDMAPSGVRNLTTVTIGSYVAGTDYTVNNETGMVTILEGGTIPETGPLSVSYTAASYTRNTIASSDEQIEGAIKFVSTNPTGPRYDYTLPYVNLAANGDLGLISQEWMQMPFRISALRKGELARLYVDGRVLVP